jgi:hypothetical protein
MGRIGETGPFLADPHRQLRVRANVRVADARVTTHNLVRVRGQVRGVGKLGASANPGAPTFGTITRRRKMQTRVPSCL